VGAMVSEYDKNAPDFEILESFNEKYSDSCRNTRVRTIIMKYRAHGKTYQRSREVIDAGRDIFHSTWKEQPNTK